MRKVKPYRTFHGAARALDNGGRFFNLFTRAGDDVVSRAELARVAGVTGGVTGALVFFEMALCELGEGDRSRLVAMLEPKLRRRLRDEPVESIAPERFARNAVAGRPYIVEGRAKKVASKTGISGFIFIPVTAGNVTSFSMIPITEVYDVYEVSGTRVKSGPGCRLTLRKKTDIALSRPIRWGGVAKEQHATKDRDSRKDLYLEPCCYMPLAD
jgi:hypothetical protein